MRERKVRKDSSAWYRALDGLGQPVLVLSPDRRIVFINQAGVDAIGRPRDKIVDQKCCTVLHNTESPPEACPFGKVRTRNHPASADMVSEALGKTFLVTCSPLLDTAGRLESVVHFMTDTTTYTQTLARVRGQERVLEMVARGTPLPEVLTELVRLVESHAPETLGSILLVDGAHLRHVAAPSLPAEYVAAVGRVPIGPCSGSCGTAAYRQEAVFVEDIARDPLWTDYRDAALPHGLRACWSTPIFGRQRELLGTFAVYFHQPALPQPKHLKLIESVTHIAAIAITHHLTLEEVRTLDDKLRERIAELKRVEHHYHLLAENTRDVLWVRDLDLRLTYVNPAVTRLRGISVEQAMNQSLAETLTPTSFALAQSVLEEELARERSGQANPHRTRTLQLEFRRADGSTFWGETTVTFLRDEAGRPTGILGLTRDVTDRVQAEQAVQRALDGAVRTAGRIAELRDPYTAGHQRRTAELACAIARELGLSEDQTKGLQVAALLHDIGKAAIPTEILSKPGALTEIELALVRRHPHIGYEILREIEFPWPVADIVRQHHERLNGSGYPRGLRGEEISIEARILAVADVVEAMSSHRPYRPAHLQETALDEIRAHRGTLYDPHAVDACLRLFARGQFTFADAERSDPRGAIAPGEPTV